MAIKGDRYIVQDDITFFMNETAEKGQIVCFSTGGSGVALDQAAALLTVKANSSGAIPFGMLVCDVVNLDLTRQHLNFHNDEVQVGSKVTVVRKGWVPTDKISGSPTIGQVAYLTSSGVLTATGNGLADRPLVGQFLSIKDEDGFAKVEINL